MLWELRKHLQETHWRVDAQTPGWSDYGAFYGFIVIALLSLAGLAGRCRKAGLTAIRAANLSILLLGFAFVILGLHSGDKNYLYLELARILPWQDLGAYLKLDFLFAPPFLAAWLVAYGLVYYLLRRSGQEARIFYVTGAFGTVFSLIYLRELMAYREELLLASCLGLLCFGPLSRIVSAHIVTSPRTDLAPASDCSTVLLETRLSA